PAGLGIEVELIGPNDYVKPGLDSDLHFQPELYECFDPGVDGIGVELNGRSGRTRPSVIIATANLPALALQHAESDAGFTAETKEKWAKSIRYFRFRTVHLWQADAMSGVVHLKRGMTVISESGVTVESVDSAIQAAVTHVLRRQRRDAWFHYEYLP